LPYVTGAQIKAEAQSGVVASAELDALYDEIADAVSTAIDGWCFRSFAVPTEATARTYRPTRDLCAVDELDDIASTSGLIVKTDTGGDGTYATTLSATDYVAEVDNLTGMVTAIRSAGLFPYSTVRPRSVQVTARYGWPATPDPVKRAAMIWSLRLVNRRSSPTGVMGFGEFGGIRLSTIDPDVRTLLAPYRLRGRLLR